MRYPENENHTWALHEAKAKFSYIINQASEDGIQKITKNGEEVAVIISIQKYEELTASKKSLLDVFRECPYPDAKLEVERTKDYPRDIEL